MLSCKLKYINIPYGFPIITAQEKELLIDEPLKIQTIDQNISIIEYSSVAQKEFCKNWSTIFQGENKDSSIENLKDQVFNKKFR